jgi:hypothetical protein
VVALGAKSALDIVLCEVENNKRTSTPKNNPILSIQRADEQPYAMAVGDDTPSVTVDIDRMIRNAEKRKDDY